MAALDGCEISSGTSRLLLCLCDALAAGRSADDLLDEAALLEPLWSVGDEGDDEEEEEDLSFAAELLMVE